MDFRALIVALALLCLCVCPSNGTLTSTDPVITIDNMVDQASSQVRNVEVSFQVTVTASAGENPHVCNSGGNLVTVTSSNPSVTPTVTAVPSTACSGPVCTDTFKVTFTLAAGYCGTSTTFGGVFPISYTLCDNTTPSGSAITSNSLDLGDRGVCISTSPSIAVVTANIVPSGPFADAAFSNDKSGIFSVNDVVYFPFKVTYNGLTISKLAFNTITVVSGSSSVDLYATTSSDSSNTGIGNTIGLQTTTTGTSIVWFSVRLNRETGSPFADTPSGTVPTAYTFYVTFDVTYKNAKRSMQPEQGEQLRSAATIRIVNEAPAAIQANLAEVLPLSNTAQPLRVGILCFMTFLLALYFAY